MSNVQEIADKYLRLVAVFEDKNLGENSAEAQSLLAELAKVGSSDFVAAYKRAFAKMSRNQKQFIDLKVRTAVLKLRQAGGNQQPTPQKPIQQKQSTNADKPKAKPVSKPSAQAAQNSDTATSPQPTAATTKKYTLPDKVAQDLHTYLYTDADDYSDEMADYISKDGMLPKDKRAHALTLLSALKSETYKPLQASTHLDRSKIVFLAMTIRQELAKKPSKEVQKKIDELMKRMSDKSIRGYIARATQKDQFGEDLFLKDIMKARNPDSQEYVKQLIAEHISELLEKLDDKQKAKYVAVQTEKGYGDYMPKIEIKGDSTMADDTNQNTELDDKQKEELKKYEEIAKVAGFNLGDVNPKNYDESIATLKKIEKDFEMAAGGNSGQPSSGNGGNPDDGKDGTPTAGDDTKNPALTFEKLDEGKNRDLPQPIQPVDWVQKKIEHYTELARNGKIADFTYDKENKTEFVASFDNASIRYTSEDNVQVSDNAGIKVFETILNEEENKNRNINFAQNMPHDMAMKLKAACLLNDRNMTGELPDFTQADLEKLHTELGAERFAQLQQKIAEQDNKNTLPADTRSAENINADQKEIIINNPEDLDKVLADAKKARKDLKDKFDKGFIEFKENPETREKEIIAGPKLQDNPDKDKILKEAKANGDLLVAITKAHDKYNKQKLEQIRSNMNTDVLAAHDAKADQVALIHAKRMGLIGDKVVRQVKEGDKFVEKEVQTIKDDKERQAYASERNKNEDLAKRIDKVVQQSKQRTV